MGVGIFVVRFIVGVFDQFVFIIALLHTPTPDTVTSRLLLDPTGCPPESLKLHPVELSDTVAGGAAQVAVPFSNALLYDRRAPVHSVLPVIVYVLG